MTVNTAYCKSEPRKKALTRLIKRKEKTHEFSTQKKKILILSPSFSLISLIRFISSVFTLLTPSKSVAFQFFFVLVIVWRDWVNSVSNHSPMVSENPSIFSLKFHSFPFLSSWNAIYLIICRNMWSFCVISFSSFMYGNITC